MPAWANYEPYHCRFFSLVDRDPRSSNSGTDQNIMIMAQKNWVAYGSIVFYFMHQPLQQAAGSLDSDQPLHGHCRAERRLRVWAVLRIQSSLFTAFHGLATVKAQQKKKNPATWSCTFDLDLHLFWQLFPNKDLGMIFYRQSREIQLSHKVLRGNAICRMDMQKGYTTTKREREREREKKREI